MKCNVGDFSPNLASSKRIIAEPKIYSEKTTSWF